MSVSENDLDRVRLLLLAAAEDAQVWDEALTAFAEACGGFCGQLIARNRADGLLLHLLTNVDPHMTHAGEASGMGDLARNPRLRIGHRAPMMKPLVEQDFVSEDVRRKYTIYPDFYDRYDFVFNTQAVLHRDDDMLVRTSVTRNKAQGPWEPDDLRVFTALLPYVQAAARQQLLAERRNVDGLLSAAEASGAVILVLNRFGWLIGASSEAERLLRSGSLLRPGQRGIRASATAQDKALQAAIAQGLGAWTGAPFPPDAPVTLTGGETEGHLRLKVVTLPPKEFSLSAEPAVLIVGVGRSAELEPDALRQVYRLSPAEIDVVQSLRSGLSPGDIADKRGVSVGTVRMQLKSIFRKVGVSRQSELVARVRG
jgi:DNA-binding CsgD family transcriptional regulator